MSTNGNNLAPWQIEQLNEALQKSFPFDHQLRQLSQFSLGINLNTIAGPNSPQPEKTLGLIEYASSQHKIADLLLKARELNEGSSWLKRAAGDFEFHEEVEALVRSDAVDFPDPEVLRHRMAE